MASTLSTNVACRTRIAQRSALQPSTAAVRSMPRAHRLRVQAVDPTVALAVGQQQLGFALVFGLENAYTFLDNKDGTPGRPSLPLAGGVVGAAVVGSQLISSGQDGVTQAGLALALVATGAGLFQSGKRWTEAKGDIEDWPGPKAWPFASIIVSFFALNAVIQGLQNL